MSGVTRSALLFSLVRRVRRPPRVSCLETLNHSKTAQFTSARGLSVHSLTTRYLADCEAKHQWMLLQRSLCSEAPSKDDEYPPLPEYTPVSKENQAKESYIVQAKGLPWSCTAEDIMSFFSECRIRGGVNGVHILYNKYGKPSGQAFIELEHEEDVGKALDQHRHYLRDRFIEVREVTNKDAEAILKASKERVETDAVVRLRGLPYSCTEGDIIRFFSGLDVVEDGVTIILTRRGRSSGEAFVEFATKTMAEKALKKDREVLGNRYIEIFPAMKSAVPPQNGRWQNDRVFTPRAEDVQLRSTAVTKNFIHMRGLPFDAKAEDIVKFFAPVRLLKIVVEFGPEGKPTGEAEAYFKTHEDAVLAMSKDREFIMERYIELYLNSCPSSEER
ncbi:G-rich sequence factor 1 [Danio aesculapii]|uniref:G-rich sequence factor 1 n=1 Tax=Danio aesculapii TaxID=1142201 RepID=UPI0024BF51E0|nr:G-rich sequence factor 1 [Danio aesculapii]